MELKVQSVDIKFNNLTYTVPSPKSKHGKKDVLKSISGKFKSGEITAIMGPSGAGKSTLMNILTGFVKTGIHGTINFGRTSHSRKICCYILQDDHFFPWLTVEEAMLLAATLKISNNSMNLKEKQLLIDGILQTLGLSSTKQTRCSRLSGGQKKRLSIALELIDNPPVLFLDEPTTGLDSVASFDTMKMLEELSMEGRTIVCTIHQPSAPIYYIFNHIYVMDRGHCVYQGSPKNTVGFLFNIGLECPTYHNPADFLLEVVNREFGDYSQSLREASKDIKWRENADSYESILENCEKSAEANRITLNDTLPPNSHTGHWNTYDTTKHIYPPPEWIRLWVLIGRCHMQFYKDWTVTYLKLGFHIMCAILLGVTFGDSGTNATKAISNVGLLMICIVYLWYTTLMPGILKFPLEIETIKKETFNNWYKLGTYFLATLITSTPVHIIFSTLFTTIMYIMTDQPFELGRFVRFVLIIIAVTITADGLGITLGTLLNPVNGTFIGAILTCFCLLFSGFLILFEHMSGIMRVVSYFSAHRYALESLVLSIYDNNRPEMICPEDIIYCHFKSANKLLQELGMDNGNYSFNVVMLLVQITLFKSMAYLSLRRKLRAQ